jgi:integrase
MQRKETHALSFDQGRELLALMPSPVREMALLSMTASLNVAEMLALRWKRVNLTTESVVAGSEVLQSHTLVVRENYYRGKFGTVKAKSRRRAVPLSTTVVAALTALRGSSRFIQPPSESD